MRPTLRVRSSILAHKFALVSARLYKTHPMQDHFDFLSGDLLEYAGNVNFESPLPEGTPMVMNISKEIFFPPSRIQH